eukprot:s2893_g7.t1
MLCPSTKAATTCVPPQLCVSSCHGLCVNAGAKLKAQLPINLRFGYASLDSLDEIEKANPPVLATLF